ncbi:transcriptional regulator [Lactobacillus pasteurii DSM 23907 = CRBIP 24.76]|uniref:Transcriptional regulator n=1 Tax=Lactobacillus pasteurii DSM 23907 = CRBIP 24.76 TaxID=1423790 RepID=I7JX21_9LACO|nr:LCP family protein [Lactobacillus pasteurii]KRK07917.1 transcriptional regulator [Lactobacillus pasteurii DSM 23907 = CRBIP 24.76]TDG77918.1 hypothetical protein C5L33_001723 [Lactobacillus pasteurii]CCI84315.1 Transcriptional regulator [Lactobacillus pasteurii DSM 23907 = CRBIP 24.76]
MEQHPKRREYQQQHHLRSSASLSRNQAFALADGVKAPQNLVARIIALTAVLAVSFAVAWAAHLYFAIHSGIDQVSGHTATSARIAAKQPISILVLGVDQGIEGRHDRGNSDTMILATANPGKNTATMTSIPRDTLADIKGDPGDKYYIFRINSAYELGGSQAAVKTVSSLLNVPVQYYVEVNMKALKSLVNALGGVDVQVPFDFSYDWCDFHKGKQHLNGRHAVAYVRMRKEDPRGDYGRQLRQRQVIEAIAKKAMSVNTLSNYRKLVTIFSKYVKTNLSFNDMIFLALNYRGVMKNLKSGYIQGHDAWIDGSSIQVAPTSELQKISNMVRKNLNLETETLNNEETRQNKLNENNVNWDDPNAFTTYQVYDKSSSDTNGSSADTNAEQSSSSSNGGLFGGLFK